MKMVVITTSGEFYHLIFLCAWKLLIYAISEHTSKIPIPVVITICTGVIANPDEYYPS